MSTIEEKILNGPQVHYCDANNDDIREDEDKEEASLTKNDVSSLFVRPDEETERLNAACQRIPNFSVNTGPKGVIEDHRQYKQGTGHKTTKDDELEAEFDRLLNDDSILTEYISKRIAEERTRSFPTFGRVFRLRTGPELLDAIDKENPNVVVVVHIYTKYSRICTSVDRCLDVLADELKQVKFVTLDASVAGLSSNFKENGVPALLSYRNGALVKSLVSLKDLLDKDFDVAEMKKLLFESGIILGTS